MSGRTFAQVSIALWRDARFKTLSERGQRALLFCWTGPHSTSAGVGILFDGYAALDLGLSVDEWIAAREEVEAAGLIARDPETETILVRDYFKANRPSSQKHVAAIRSQIATIVSDELRHEAERALAENSPTVAADRPSPHLLAIAGRQNMGRSA
ncbi:MAG: hypothetical protein KGO94_09935 [Alphaproteobacteria bacterium]|nr:hypothetical protein [Alphaproteobacteria bacterium]